MVVVTGRMVQAARLALEPAHLHDPLIGYQGAVVTDGEGRWLRHTPIPLELAREAIAAVEGIDGIFIGPSDLAADLGHLANPRHPEVQATIADACARIRAAGKGAGMLTGDPEEACRYLAAGFTFVAMGSDAGVLASATAKLAALGKEQVAQITTGTTRSTSK